LHLKFTKNTKKNKRKNENNAMSMTVGLFSTTTLAEHPQRQRPLSIHSILFLLTLDRHIDIFHLHIQYS
jgi:hypothetical protein